jgi:hypothetical protein
MDDAEETEAASLMERDDALFCSRLDTGFCSALVDSVNESRLARVVVVVEVLAGALASDVLLLLPIKVDRSLLPLDSNDSGDAFFNRDLDVLLRASVAINRGLTMVDREVCHDDGSTSMDLDLTAFDKDRTRAPLVFLSPGDLLTSVEEVVPTGSTLMEDVLVRRVCVYDVDSTTASKYSACRLADMGAVRSGESLLGIGGKVDVLTLRALLLAVRDDPTLIRR